MADKLTVQVSLIKILEGGMDRFVENPVEHTYETQKAALEDYRLLSKMLKKFSEIPEVTPR